MRTFWSLQGKRHHGTKAYPGFQFEHGRADWPLWAGQEAGPEACQPWEHSGALDFPGTQERPCPTDLGSRNDPTGAKSLLCLGELLKLLFEGIHAWNVLI